MASVTWVSRARRKIVFSLRASEGADVCFPLTTWIEKDGTVISAGNRLQRLSKGITFEPTLLTERVVIDRLHALIDSEFKGPDTAAQALAALAENVPAFAGLSWQKVGLHGATLDTMQEAVA